MAPHGKRDPKKPGGRRTAYAFFVQYFREQQKKQFPEYNVPFPQLSQQCAATWHKLTAEQKVYFDNMAEKDKERYQEEMRNYQPPAADVAVKKLKKQTKKAKDPNAPKKPLTAFFWFSNDERPAVKNRFPNYDFREVGRELGRMWAALDTIRKNQYICMAQRDRERYNREQAVYSSSVNQGQSEVQAEPPTFQQQP